MNIALAQINPTVGALEKNAQKIIQYIQHAQSQHCDLLIFPEMAIVGYPPKDLLLKKNLIDKNLNLLHSLISHTKNITIIVGFVDKDQQQNLYNAAAVISNQKIIKTYHKVHLPNYDVFDEKRYFKPGNTSANFELFTIHNTKIGLSICEDIWIDHGPVQEQAKHGADLIINISASPFHAGKGTIRENLIRKRAKENNIPIIYANLVGAQDDLIFDGRSYFFNNQGQILAQGKTFEEDFIILPEQTIKRSQQQSTELQQKIITPTKNITKDIHDALVLGIKDYFQKNGFKKAVIGLSGGIDSALTAALAVKALGKENVMGITMPSKFSSTGSVDDSYILAKNLGIQIHTLPIKNVFDSYLTSLQPLFNNITFNVAEENIQARIRGNYLMAVSNKFGHLVLATGNKSELSVGYATLYGDMAGGLAVISDLFKTTVYEVCKYINDTANNENNNNNDNKTEKKKEIIPNSIITKEPSAELREDQKDSDSLPIYPILDPILQAYIEEEKSKEEIIAKGFDQATVERVIKMVDRNEYKRQQAALGFRITPRAFGSGRRIPITNGWQG